MQKRRHTQCAWCFWRVIHTFLANRLLWVDEQCQQARQSAAVHDDLRLHVITRDDVAHRAQSGSLDVRRSVHQQLHQTTRHTRLNHGLNLLVLRTGVVAHVGQRPACICEHLVVHDVEQSGEHGQSSGDEHEIGLRLAAAKIGQGPGGVAQHGDLGVGRAEIEERLQSAGLQYQIAALSRVAGDVAELHKGSHNKRRVRNESDQTSFSSPSRYLRVLFLPPTLPVP